MMYYSSGELPIQPAPVHAVFADAFVTGHQNIFGFDSKLIEETIPFIYTNKAIYNELCYMPARLFDSITSQVLYITKPD